MWRRLLRKLRVVVHLVKVEIYLNKKEVKEELETAPPEEEPKPAADVGVILCSEEPSMTRQLNAFSNIVRRVLLFGDDQEILILSETLAGNDKVLWIAGIQILALRPKQWKTRFAPVSSI